MRRENFKLRSQSQKQNVELGNFISVAEKFDFPAYILRFVAEKIIQILRLENSSDVNVLEEYNFWFGLCHWGLWKSGWGPLNPLLTAETPLEITTIILRKTRLLCTISWKDHRWDRCDWFFFEEKRSTD